MPKPPLLSKFPKRLAPARPAREQLQARPASAVRKKSEAPRHLRPRTRVERAAKARQPSPLAVAICEPVGAPGLVGPDGGQIVVKGTLPFGFKRSREPLAPLASERVFRRPLPPKWQAWRRQASSARSEARHGCWRSPNRASAECVEAGRRCRSAACGTDHQEPDPDRDRPRP